MDGLLSAYLRRKRWEARLFGVATVNALGEAMAPKKQPTSLAMLAGLGFRIENGNDAG